MGRGRAPRLSRNETLGLAAGVGLAAGFAVALATGTADSLNARAWFGSGANVIQWASGVAFLATIVAAVTMHMSRACAARTFCFRRGEHPVAGTLQKVCHHHHHLSCHEAVHARHADTHARSGRLDFGESHRTG